MVVPFTVLLVRVARPSGQELVVQRGGFGGCLRAGGVIGGGVELLGPFGGGDKVKHRIVAVPKLDLIGAQELENLGKFGVGHVGFVIQGAAVADDEDLVGGHGAGGLEEKSLLFQLQFQLALLIFGVGAAGPGGHAVGDKLRGCFGDKQNRIA